ncbi:hypothetical protein AX14_002902 [Amanita brunnescens Koide BX004]|nr:hypothetical protein AX14_002902 [Amanita brunnescens Koide BX004]
MRSTATKCATSIGIAPGEAQRIPGRSPSVIPAGLSTVVEGLNYIGNDGWSRRFFSLCFPVACILDHPSTALGSLRYVVLSFP